MKTVFIILFCLYPLDVYTQENDSVRSFGKILSNGFDVVESSEELTKKSDESKLPSRLMITIPSDTSVNTYLVDITIGTNIKGFFYKDNSFSSSARHDVKFLLFNEFHKNTLIKKETNIYKIGLSTLLFTNILWKKMWVNLDFTYYPISRNYVKNQWGSQMSSYVVFSYDDTLENIWYYLLPSDNGTKFGDSSQHYYKYYPKIGYEYSSFTRGEEPLKGNIHSFFAGIEFNIDLFDGIVKGNADYQYRRYFKNTTLITENTYVLFKGGINVNLMRISGIEEIDLLIGYDYFNGANPWKGIEKQRYSQISFKLRI